jgi:ferric-dicitrate binding protein FerR (iron transport regulator)
VPAAQLDEARAFLADSAVPEDELEAQAMAEPAEAGQAETGPATPALAALARPRRRRWLPLLIVLGAALLLALWVLALWLIHSLGDPAGR